MANTLIPRLLLALSMLAMSRTSAPTQKDTLLSLCLPGYHQDLRLKDDIWKESKFWQLLRNNLIGYNLMDLSMAVASYPIEGSRQVT